MAGTHAPDVDRTAEAEKAVRILFYKSTLAWPRLSGDDVHTSQMMCALARLGAHVTFATAGSLGSQALSGIPIDAAIELDGRDGDFDHVATPIRLSALEERFQHYWGIPRGRITALGQLANHIDASAVVVAGLDALPLLAGIRRGVRVWYAGDEWTWHHLSQVQMGNVTSWRHVTAAAVKGLYERTYAPHVDRAWTVSDADARSLRWISGIAHVDTIPNGVDASAYTMCAQREEPETAIFWGRLDFGPNLQALEWFIDHVWPCLRRTFPAARFTIAGYHPGAAAHRLAKADGITMLADVPDLRPLASRHAVVVLPFVSGGGVKNKLLEAAAMGKAIVASPRTLCGLQGEPPLCQARTSQEWVDVVSSLWNDREARHDLGRRARTWVTREHTWPAAARAALDSIRRSILQAGVPA